MKSQVGKTLRTKVFNKEYDDYKPSSKHVGVFKTFANTFFVQKLHKEKMRYEYQPELFSLSLLSVFDVKDRSGNPLTFYEKNYVEFKKYVADNYDVTITALGDLEKLKEQQLLDALCHSNVRMVRYLTPANLAPYLLDIKSFNEKGILKTVGGTVAIENHPNCVVMLPNNKIYFAPKTRSEPGNISSLIKINDKEFELEKKGKGSVKEGLIGINHSSLSNGQMIKFGGLFVRTKDDKQWTIETHSGHYGTKAYQLRGFLEQLNKQNFELSNILIKTRVYKNPKKMKEEEIEVHVENAKECFERINNNMAKLKIVK